MINVIASITVKEGRKSDFLKIFKANVPAVRKEKGCIEYFPSLDLKTGIPVQELNPRNVTIIEKWESLEALKAHLKTPHMLDYKEKVKDIVESVSLKVLEEA